MILAPASEPTTVIGIILLILAFILAVCGSSHRRRTLVRVGGVIISLAAIREIAFFLAFLTSGGNDRFAIGPVGVLGSIETYLVLATFVLLVWIPQVFFTIQLDVDGTGDAQRVLLSLITATASGLTAVYFLFLHFSGGPLRSVPPGPLVAAIIGTVLIVAPPYKALARACWQRGLSGVFHPKTLRQHSRNMITELGKALDRGGPLTEKGAQEATNSGRPNPSAADPPSVSDLPSVANLWAGEHLLGSWVAGIPDSTATLSLVGGILLLTDQRLIFEPRKVRGNHVIVQITDAVVSLRSHYIALADIAGVSATATTIKVDLTNGTHRYYKVYVKGLSPIWSKKGRSAREDAVERVGGAAKQARPITTAGP